MIRDFCHRIVAAVLLVGIAPLLLVLYVLMRGIARQQESFFYRGERLGRNKQRFYVYKIRTLSLSATYSSHTEMFRPGTDPVLKYGKFLRETRLDELPQLLNVLKGDMMLVGPRPIRPALYEQSYKNIKGYDRRFAVKPGITGYSQLLTAPRTPKPIRSVIDNHFAERPLKLWTDVCLLMMTVRAFTRALWRFLIRKLIDDYGMLRSRLSLKCLRLQRRFSPKHVTYRLLDGNRSPLYGDTWRPMKDIDYEALSVESEVNLDEIDCITILLQVPVRKGIRRAESYALIYRKTSREVGGKRKFKYVLFYTPKGIFSRYIIDQYVLGDKLG